MNKSKKSEKSSSVIPKDESKKDENPNSEDS